uniref:Uncharacterized protein n=1 Tax=Caenorhabditis tropicalis TaxID=1561998 RepID=A0A1I7UL55_9PELO
MYTSILRQCHIDRNDIMKKNEKIKKEEKNKTNVKQKDKKIKEELSINGRTSEVPFVEEQERHLLEDGNEPGILEIEEVKQKETPTEKQTTEDNGTSVGGTDGGTSHISAASGTLTMGTHVEQ